MTDNNITTSKKRVRENWIEILAEVYKETDWEKIVGDSDRKAVNVFEHRLQVASKNQTIPRTVKKLCRGLGVKCPDLNPCTMDSLMLNPRFSLKVLDEDTIYLTLKSKQTVNKYFEDESSHRKEMKDYIEV